MNRSDKMETPYYIDSTGTMKAGDGYGNWYIVGYKTVRHYFTDENKNSEVYSKQIRIRDLKNPKMIKISDVWKS
jgi:hypothetical protein